jgi:D-sedoheptulose 7-phosphate isomerase
MNRIKEYFQDSVKVKEAFFNSDEQNNNILKIAETCTEAILGGKKILICGNGGSASDAQHFAGEIVGRFLKERPGYACVCLNTDTSVMTAIANDYGYEEVFSRQVEGIGQTGDVFIGISTSGNSKNVISAIEKCKNKGMFSIGLLGGTGGKVADMCDLSLIVPSKTTSFIQETHITVVHILCKIIEEMLVDHAK